MIGQRIRLVTKGQYFLLPFRNNTCYIHHNLQLCKYRALPKHA